MIDQLLHVLKQLLDIHVQLLNTGIKKKEALIQGDVDRLSTILKEEDPLIRQLGKLEEERLSVVQQLYSEKQIENVQLPLVEFLPYVTEVDMREQLEQVYDKLKATITEFQHVNELNVKLIHDSLDFVNQSIELLTDVGAEQMNYKQPTQAGADVSARRSFFDTKA